MFPMVTPDGIETGGCYNHMCRAAKRSRGSSLLLLHRRLLAAAGLAFLVTSSAAFAQGGPPAMPVTVSAPVAKRVTQWDEFSGRFEAVASVEVRARQADGVRRVAAVEDEVLVARTAAGHAEDWIVLGRADARPDHGAPGRPPGAGAPPVLRGLRPAGGPQPRRSCRAESR